MINKTNSYTDENVLAYLRDYRDLCIKHRLRVCSEDSFIGYRVCQLSDKLNLIKYKKETNDYGVYIFDFSIKGSADWLGREDLI